MGRRLPSGSGEGDGDEEGEDPVVELKRYDFVVQFVWVPQIPGQPMLDGDGAAAAGAGRSGRSGGSRSFGGRRGRRDDDDDDD